jgi:hypothetical protein
MDSAADTRIAVPPTRIAEMGIGSFLVLAGGSLLPLCYAGSMLAKNPRRTNIQLLATAAYALVIAFLAGAKRRSQWEIRDEVISDVDNTWLIRILVGLTMAVGCGLGILAVFMLDICATVVAREIVSENEILLRRRRKFLF